MAFELIFGSGDMGEGSDAVDWEIGDINGDGQLEVIQLWRNDSGNLGVTVYGWQNNAMARVWSTSDLGADSDADAWKIGDINGDGRPEIVQMWSEDDKLGITVYGWQDNALTPLWTKNDMGEGSGAICWQIGDINGDGRAELIQLWRNHDELGIIVYGWQNDKLQQLWATTDTGQGAGAIDWKIGDINGDGRAEIVQLWKHHDSLGIIVYGWENNGLSMLWGTGDMGQGPGALDWEIGDVNGDGRAEIIQLWNGGFIVYGWQNDKLSTISTTGEIYTDSYRPTWEIGDINGDGRAEIVQMFGDNDNQLGMVVYGWRHHGMAKIWSSNDVGQGSGAVAWKIGDINGDKRAELVQLWKNTHGSGLGMIAYGFR